MVPECTGLDVEVPGDGEHRHRTNQGNATLGSETLADRFPVAALWWIWPSKVQRELVMSRRNARRPRRIGKQGLVQTDLQHSRKL